MTQAIEVSGLRKAYGKTLALDGLDLSVSAGEVHGFLGPNGAGKTTTIRILLGLLRADGGIARLLGGDPWRAAVALHRRLAYVPGDVTLWPNLTGGEVIDLLAALRGPAPGGSAQSGSAPGGSAPGGSRKADAARRDSLLERFDLDPTKKARAYSKGNRQKVALIAALASDAELLILDEPTSGLDPLMEAQFRACIEEERQRGRTVLLSSHILSEAEALCDRVTIIRAGRTVETGSLTQLRHLTRTSIAAELARVPEGLDQLPGVHDLVVDPSPDAAGAGGAGSGDAASGDAGSGDAGSGDAGLRGAGPGGAGPGGAGPSGGCRVRCEVDAEHLAELLGALVTAGVRSLVSKPPTLEELFLRHYAANQEETPQDTATPPASATGKAAGQSQVPA